MAKTQQIITGYYRVGSESQILKQLNDINSALTTEEAYMKELASEFMRSSANYDKLRRKQRSILGQMFMEKKERA